MGLPSLIVFHLVSTAENETEAPLRTKGTFCSLVKLKDSWKIKKYKASIVIFFDVSILTATCMCGIRYIEIVFLKAINVYVTV